MILLAAALLALAPPSRGQDLERAFWQAHPLAARTAAFLRWPEDIPLARFKRLDEAEIFLLKHRLRLPAKIEGATPEDIVAGKLNVEVGVEVEGTVTRVYRAFDRDYTFDFGDLHLEITPEWRKLHPRMPLPKLGQRVRVRGWTYYDVFHKAEDAEGRDHWHRKTLWEVHPVLDVQPLGVPLGVRP